MMEAFLLGGLLALAAAVFLWFGGRAFIKALLRGKL